VRRATAGSVQPAIVAMAHLSDLVARLSPRCTALRSKRIGGQVGVAS